jgi:hypothetical protein
VLALGVALASACGSFGAAPLPADDATAASDAGAVDAPVEGAAPPDGGATCLPPICEDFETDAWKVLWTTKGPSQIDVSDGASTSGVRALDLRLSDRTPAYIVRQLGAGPFDKVVASVNMRVLERGDGEIDLFEVGDSLLARGVIFVHADATGSFVCEASAGAPSNVIPTPVQSLATYTRIVIELDFRKGVYALTVGAQAVNGLLDATWNPAQLVVALGAPFAGGSAAKRWRVRFDDLSVTTEP